MNRILKLQERLTKYPFGNRLLSYAISRKAPYFLSIRPRIIELKAGFMKVAMRKRYAVTNHIKTIHAIAMCNLCEYAGGICMEATIPPHKRWIPKSMDVKYLQKATTNLTATCDLSHIDWENEENVICSVSVRDEKDVEVMTANITMYVSNRK